jgi:formyl-CoA transferase
MADYGAEVIKIEPPGGDGYRRLHGVFPTDYNWQLTSRNKQDIAVDIKADEGLAVVLKLLEDADVMITNFRDDQLENYGLGRELLLERFPQLIVAQLTGYGNVGPDRLRRGYDSTAWFARTGIMQLAKSPGEAPPFPPGGVGDHATAMTLFAGIMMALYRRQNEGKGGFVETSLIATGAWANGMQLQGAIAGFDVAKIVEEKGSRSPFAMVYETRDNRYITLVLTHPNKEWPEMAHALGHPEWIEDERFSDFKLLMRHRDVVRSLFAEAIGCMMLNDLCIALDGYHLTYGVVEGLTEVVEDAHLIENGIVTKTESDDPAFGWTIANPIRIDNESRKPVGDPPGFGEHTESILLAHGFSSGEIKRLLKDRIVFAENPDD